MSRINYILFLSFFLFSGISLSHILDFIKWDYEFFGSVSLKFLYWFVYLVLILAIALLTTNSRLKFSFFQVLRRSKIKIFLLFIIYSTLGVFISSAKVEGVKVVLNLGLPFVVFITTYQYSWMYSNNFENIKKVLWLSLSLNFIIGIVMWMFGHSFFMKDYSGTIRFVGSMGWATFAYFLIPYIIILFDKFLYKKEYVRSVGFLLFIVLSLLILITISRTAILGYFLILFVGYFILTKINSIKIVSAVLVGGLMAIVIYDKLVSRSFVSESGIIATSGRLVSAVYLFDQNVNSVGDFLLGAGTGTSTTQVLDLAKYSVNSTHSYLLDVFIDNGLIGLILLLGFFVAILLKFYKLKMLDEHRHFIPIGALLFLLPLFLFDNSIAVFTNGVLYSFAGHFEAKIDHKMMLNESQESI